jgi:hypothetical protein
VNNCNTCKWKFSNASVGHASGAQIHIKVGVVERVDFRKIRAGHKHALACALKNKSAQILFRKFAQGRIKQINQPAIKHNNATARLGWIWNE